MICRSFCLEDVSAPACRMSLGTTLTAARPINVACCSGEILNKLNEKFFPWGEG